MRVKSGLSLQPLASVLSAEAAPAVSASASTAKIVCFIIFSSPLEQVVLPAPGLAPGRPPAPSYPTRERPPSRLLAVTGAATGSDPRPARARRRAGPLGTRGRGRTRDPW